MQRTWAIAGAIAVFLIPATAGAVPMTFESRDTGQSAGEPTLGALKDGTIVYQALTKTLKTTDEGATWTTVHDVAPLGLTLDPYVHVDARTDRIIASQLYGACQLISISDDAGDSWIDAATQCGTGDHQKLGSGPWGGVASPLFPSAVYTCVNHVFDTACAVSPDGGTTWGPLTTAFVGFDPTATSGVGGTRGVCGGLEGDPAVGSDGTLYLPREYCGRPYLGVSTDQGITWSLKRVGGPNSQARPIAFGANNPSVAVGDDGDVYYAWTDDAYRHHVARSSDRGATWTSDTIVSGDDIVSTTFPFVIAGADGRVATGYIGATGGKPGDPGGVGPDAVWHLYMAHSLDADAAAPTFEVTRATPADDPIMLGCVSRHEGSCSMSGHDNLLDFNDVTTLPDGRLAVSYVDACLPGRCSSAPSSNADRGYLLIQTGGPRVR